MHPGPLGLKCQLTVPGGTDFWPYREHGLLAYKEEEGLTAAGCQDIQVRDRTGWRAREHPMDAYAPPLIGHGCENALMQTTDGSPRSKGSAGSLLSIGSSGSILSIGSAGSILSIGSAGSILSIGSVGSVASVLSIGSAASAASILSGLSRWSVLAWRSAGTTGLGRRRAARLS